MSEKEFGSAGKNDKCIEEGKTVNGDVNSSITSERPNPPQGQDNSKPAPTGDRFNAGKPKLSYNQLGREVQEGEARVWEKGDKKYKRGNWLKGMAYTNCADSLSRHLSAFLNGEDVDSESGLPHVDHLVCCAKILSNSFHTRKDLDDRETTKDCSQKLDTERRKRLFNSQRNLDGSIDLEVIRNLIKNERQESEVSTTNSISKEKTITEINQMLRDSGLSSDIHEADIDEASGD